MPSPTLNHSDTRSGFQYGPTDSDKLLDELAVRVRLAVWSSTSLRHLRVTFSRRSRIRTRELNQQPAES